jgi:hypothetical protein
MLSKKIVSVVHVSLLLADVNHTSLIFEGKAEVKPFMGHHSGFVISLACSIKL